MKKTTPRGLRNNNPGNIRRSKVVYLGEKESTDPEFKQFIDLAYGFRAIFVLLHSYIRRDINTIQSIVERYAPPVENDTRRYTQFIAERTGIQPRSTISSDNPQQMIPIVAAIAHVENGQEPDPQAVQAGWDLYLKHRP